MNIERCTTCLEGPHAAQLVSACVPTPWFGALTSRVEVATVGLNPALTEWKINQGWRAPDRRLPILDDFNLVTRGQLGAADVVNVQARRAGYFDNQPHAFFKPLELLLGCINPEWSYAKQTAIHFDLVACATTQRWGLLPDAAKLALKTNCSGHFRRTIELLPNSAILLLNGKPVRDGLQQMAATDTVNEIPDAGEELGFKGRIVLADRVQRYLGWSTPLSKTSGPVALAIANWIRQATT